MCDILWSDPIKENGRKPSKRGCGIGFGPDVAANFLKENNLGKLKSFNLIINRISDKISWG